MWMVRAIAVGMLSVVLGCAGAWSQCPAPNDLDPDAPPPIAPPDFLSYQGDEQILPETGYLSNHSYTSVFFGIGLDLPIEVEGHRWMLPLMPHGQHALLGLAFQEGHRDGTLTIIASEPSNEQPKETAQQKQEDFLRWARGQPALHRVPPDWMMRSGHFNHVSRKKGDEYTLQYWTRIKNYTLRFTFTSNDEEFMKQAKHAMDTARVYCPEEDGTLITENGDRVEPQGSPYEGPTVPTARVEAKLNEKLEDHAIPAGEVRDGRYRNPELGLEYTLPAGWKVRASQAREDSFGGLSDQRTSQFLQACSETLVRAVKDTPAAQGAHNASPTIVLRALDPACLSLRGPDTVQDRQGAEELEAYLQMLKRFGQIRTAVLVAASGHVFAVYRGTIGERDEGQELAARSSETIFATRYNKLVFLWSVIEPKGANQKDVPPGKVIFGGNETVELGPSLLAKH